MKPLYWTPALIVFTLAGCQPASSDKIPEAGTNAAAQVNSETPSPQNPVEPAQPSPGSGNDTVTLPAADPLKTETGGVAQITDADCGADKVKAYVGKDATDAVRAEVTAKSGAQSVRWITPETMVTMDLRHDRLNAHLGTNGKIGSFRCG